jgi:hypothetical protein
MSLDPLHLLGLPEAALEKLAQAKQPSVDGVPSQLTAEEVEVMTSIQQRLAAAADQ